MTIDDGGDVWGHAAERGCTPAFRRNAPTPWPECSFAYTFSAAVSIAGDAVLAGALDGRAFAFDSADGSALWQYATSRDYETVNGVAGHGGATTAPASSLSTISSSSRRATACSGKCPACCWCSRFPGHPKTRPAKPVQNAADQPRSDEQGDDA